MKKNRSVLIALSVVVGIVLACAILPLGGFALLLATVDTSTTSGPNPAITWQERKVSGSGTDRILILEAIGMIGGPDLNGASHDEFLSQIRQAVKDPHIKAVVMRVESPGGGVVASSEIYEQLKELDEKNKPLIVSMGPIAASGGYYISAGADRIYANPDTITGSLGVIISSIKYEEAFDKLGLEQVIYKSGKFKDILSPARDATPEEQEILQDFVDGAYQRFVDVIVEGRDLPRENVLDLADGRIYSGAQALDAGLIDSLGNLDDALDGAKELAGLPESALVVKYRTSIALRDLLNAQLEANITPADPLGIREVLQQHNIKLEYRMVP
jgi:protease-4